MFYLSIIILIVVNVVIVRVNEFSSRAVTLDVPKRDSKIDMVRTIYKNHDFPVRIGQNLIMVCNDVKFPTGSY